MTTRMHRWRVWRCGALVLAGLISSFGSLIFTARPSAAATLNVIPILDCNWKDPTTGMYNTEFGYNNPNSSAVTVPVGSQNQFSSGGLPANSGQPTTFQPGKHDNVFIVTEQQNIQWVLQGTNINAPGSTTCSSNPGPGPWYGNPIVFPTLNCDWHDPSTGMHNARFGYNNPFSTSVTVAVGAQNMFSANLPSNVGQPTTFLAGKHDNVFVVTYQPNTQWFLTGTNLNAPGSTTCSSNPGGGPWYGNAVAFPILECDFVDTHTGKTNSLFGYNNPFSTSETVAVGGQNQFSGSGLSAAAGQPTTFAPGKNDNVFVVTHTTNISWALTGTNLGAPGSKACATNPVPIISDHVGSLVVAGTFAIGAGLALFFMRRRLRPTHRGDLS